MRKFVRVALLAACAIGLALFLTLAYVILILNGGISGSFMKVTTLMNLTPLPTLDSYARSKSRAKFAAEIESSFVRILGNADFTPYDKLN